MTARDLAERARIDPKTLHKAESGDPTVATGTMFELAGLVGLSLFAPEPGDLPSIVRREEDRLALLPSRVVNPLQVPDDDF